jgi:lysozyme family protein
VIYRQRYWSPICGERMAPALALLVFDAAVNNGVSRAVRLLQASVGAKEDGLLGPRTLAAVAASDPVAICREFQARRLLFMVGLPAWRSFGLGWARRLCGLPFQALAIGTGEGASPTPR